jgi:hypothetical protein
MNFVPWEAKKNLAWSFIWEQAKFDLLGSIQKFKYIFLILLCINIQAQLLKKTE